MRWVALCLVAACSGSDGPNESDDSLDAAMPSCAISVPFTGGVGIDLALNGPAMLVTAHDNTAGYSLQELANGETTLFTSPDPIPLATFASVAFIGRKQAAGYDIYMRAGSQDTMLGTVTTTGEIDLGATATDVYVLAPDGAVTRLWRIPRVGGAPVEVTSMTGTVANFHVGNMIAAFRDGTGKYQVVALPGPSNAQPVAINTDFFVGDRGLYMTGGMITQNTRSWFLNQSYPTMSTIVGGEIYRGSVDVSFYDDQFVYLTTTQQPSGGSPPTTSTRALDLNTSVSNPYPFCDAFRGGRLAWDATRLYRVSQTTVRIAPRPQ